MIEAQRPQEGPVLGIPGDCGAGVESQRAMIAAKIANIKVGENQHNKEGLQIYTPSVSVSAAAELLNVSPRSVQRAKSVQEHGTKELVKAVAP